jgi:hypothetical protein
VVSREAPRCLDLALIRFQPGGLDTPEEERSLPLAVGTAIARTGPHWDGRGIEHEAQRAAQRGCLRASALSVLHGLGRQLPSLTADGCVPAEAYAGRHAHLHHSVRDGCAWRRDVHTAANGPASGIMAPPRGQVDMVSTVWTHARAVVRVF